MELNFGKKILSCLDNTLQEVQNSEQTQEIKLPDGMPDIGRILCAWGQPILRGKEWRGDAVAASAGMMIWVLYAPEDGSAERCIDAWIPFQMRWDLPSGTPEGDIRIYCMNRFVDARSVSARKMMVRAGMAALASVHAPKELEIYEPDSQPEGLELLKSTYPVRLPVEAGEKSFLLDEDLTLPDSAPQPEKLICFRVDPRVTDKKVLSGKLVFRGNGNLHVIYRSEEGQIHAWDFELPFSQYVDLNGEHSSDAQAELWLSPTSLELELDDEGHFRLKCGIVAQFLITDKQLLELIEDAYAPGREISVQRQDLELPAVLENRRENVYAEQSVAMDANMAVDVSFQPDFPRQMRTESGVDMELPGIFQVLCYGEGGELRAGTARWEGRQSVKADQQTVLTVLPHCADTQASVGDGTVMLKTEFPMDMASTACQTIPMVAGVELGEPQPADPNRPSLILRRAGDQRLWDLAKASGSTVEAIRKANGLQEEPAPEQVLLIPVP